MADRAYGTYDLREYIANRNADFCISPKSNAVDPWYCDWSQYQSQYQGSTAFDLGEMQKSAFLLAIYFLRSYVPYARSAITIVLL